jgi:Asp-tRNA(Asn)/Glu-tRNA(Gln) amidotransferase A subunit family amidase
MALLEPGFTVAETAPRTVGVLALDADPMVTVAIDDALRTAEFDVRTVVVPGLDAVIVAAITILDAQAWAANKDLVAVAGDKIGFDVMDRLGRASAVTAAQVVAAEAVIAGWQATLDDLWQRVDMLAAPTLLGYPPLLEDSHLLFKLRALTSPVNAAGVPSLALPIPSSGQDGPIPANVQLIGPRNSEERLLAAGAVLEEAVRA